MAINSLGIPYPDFKLHEVIDPEQFDLNNLQIVDRINDILLVLNKITDGVTVGSSGADSVSIAPIAPFASTKLQAFLVSLVAELRGTGGARFIGTAPISGVTGTTAQQQLASLKALLDTTRADLIASLGSVDARLTTAVNKAQTDANNNAMALTTHKSSTDHDARYYPRANVDSLLGVKANKSEVYTRAELAPYLQGGDTRIRYEVYTITSSNNGDGTFSYTSRSGQAYVGTLTAEGHQVFTLLTGTYPLGSNAIEAVVDDALHRSVASGGLVEVASNSVALSIPESAGREITFKFFERVGITGEASVVINSIQPPDGGGNALWLKVVG